MRASRSSRRMTCGNLLVREKERRRRLCWTGRDCSRVAGRLCGADLAQEARHLRAREVVLLRGAPHHAQRALANHLQSINMWLYWYGSKQNEGPQLDQRITACGNPGTKYKRHLLARADAVALLVRVLACESESSNNMWSSWYETRACLNSISIACGQPGTKQGPVSARQAQQVVILVRNKGPVSARQA